MALNAHNKLYSTSKTVAFFILLAFATKLCPVNQIAQPESAITKFSEQNSIQRQAEEELFKKLEYYNLQVTEKPFTYNHKIEVFSSILEKSFSLDSEIEGFAKAYNLMLNNSIFFDPEFISNTKAVRAYHLKPKPFKHNIGRILECIAEDGNIIPCTYFDRESDRLLVVGGGFTNNREVMSPFIDMFPNHDVIIFDYRGHGFRENEWEFSPTKFLFNANCSKVRLGDTEDRDVIAVIETIKNKKKYKQINGLGICYSALIFAKAAAKKQKNNEKLFDHLILDGCWLSLENFTEKLAQDPKRICSPQNGGWKNNCLIKKLWLQKLFLILAQELFHTQLNQVSVLDYLPNIKDTAILFFHGKDDLVINRHEFEIMWNNTKVKEKTAIITSNPHVRNHLKQKELYKLICDLFLNLPHTEFINCLQDKEYLINYQASQLTKST
jgi:hypothetical protein